MTPEERAAIEANIRKIVEQGGGEADVMAYLKIEGFETREAWLAAREPVPSGPTEQPPNAAIDKGVDVPGLGRVSLGGGLDFLRSMVLPITEPFNTAAGDPRQAQMLAELRGRAPDAADLGAVAGGFAGGAGAASYLLRARNAARMARLSGQVEKAFMQSKLPPQYGLPVPIGSPAPAAPPIRDLLKNRWVWGAGGGALEYLRRKVLP